MQLTCATDSRLAVCALAATYSLVMHTGRRAREEAERAQQLVQKMQSSLKALQIEMTEAAVKAEADRAATAENLRKEREAMAARTAQAAIEHHKQMAVL